MLHDIQRKAGSLNRGSLPLGFLLALIGSEKERNDLCAGAAIVRSKQAITNAVGNAVLHGPRHCVCIVAVGEHIAELCLAIDQLTNGTEQESHALSTGAGGVRTEFAIARAGGDTILYCPCNCLCIIGIHGHIGEAAHGLGFGGTGSAPQEGDDLCAGARLVRPKEAVANTAGDALLGGPLHSLIVVGVGGNVREVQRLDLSEFRGNRHLGGGHGKGKLAVALILHLDLAAAGVLHGQGVQLIAAVGLDRNGHGIALGGALGADGHIAVLDRGRGDVIASGGR